MDIDWEITDNIWLTLPPRQVVTPANPEVGKKIMDILKVRPGRMSIFDVKSLLPPAYKVEFLDISSPSGNSLSFNYDPDIPDPQNNDGPITNVVDQVRIDFHQLGAAWKNPVVVSLDVEEERVSVHLYLLDPEVRDFALKVTRKTYEAVRKTGYGIGKKIPSQDSPEASETVQDLLKYHLGDNKRKSGVTFDHNELLITIEDFRMLQIDVAIRKLRDYEEKNPDWADEIGRKRLERERALMEGAWSPEDYSGPIFISPEKFKELRNQIDGDPGTTYLGTCEEDGFLLFEVSRPSKSFWYHLRFGYDESSGAFGDLELNVENLANLGDKLSVGAVVGKDARKGGLDWEAPLKENENGVEWKAKASLHYEERDEQLLGNDDPFETTTYGGGLSMRRNARMRPSKHGNWHRMLKFKVEIDAKHIDVEDEQGKTIEGGWDPTLALSSGFSARLNLHDPDEGSAEKDYRGLSRYGIGGKTSLKQGVGSNEDVEDYTKLKLSIGHELRGRLGDQQWYFLRHSALLWGTTGDTPVSELFRLGGGKTIRGMEDGEQVGNSLLATRLSVGTSLATIFPSLRSTGEKESEDDSKGFLSQFSGLVSKAHLTAFYEAGVIDTSSGIIQLTGDALEAHGWGVALEVDVGPLDVAESEFGGLQIGYAYSPDSEQHDNGLFFVDVAFHF